MKKVLLAASEKPLGFKGSWQKRRAEKNLHTIKTGKDSVAVKRRYKELKNITMKKKQICKFICAVIMILSHFNLAQFL